MAMYANIGGVNKLLAQTFAEGSAGGGVTVLTSSGHTLAVGGEYTETISIPHSAYFLIFAANATTFDNGIRIIDLSTAKTSRDFFIGLIDASKLISCGLSTDVLGYTNYISIMSTGSTLFDYNYNGWQSTVTITNSGLSIYTINASGATRNNAGSYCCAYKGL